MVSLTSSPINTLPHAQSLDAADLLTSFRNNFHIPTVNDLHRPTLATSPSESPSKPSTYLCGNSLGIQPIRTATLINTFLTQWRTKGVKGHFTPHDDSALAPFLDVDDQAAQLMAPIVGALTSEVAVMGTLTANLHLLMCSFYRPHSKSSPSRYKIMLEGKAFPSDHFAVESQIRHHGLDPSDAMILLEPKDPEHPLLTTQQILDAITQNADTLALILLPGIQFYTGQYFDIPTITRHAHSHGILIGWDCAHAAGNVELKLHDWDVDFAAWCTYKYMNSGPGAMAALFVHERFGKVDMSKQNPDERYHSRLTGWWGDEKGDRFKMTNQFVPREGAAGFQLSNPSALDTAAVIASLQIFNEAGMGALRERSLRLTKYLEELLDEMKNGGNNHFEVLSPRDPAARGAQLSIRLKEGLLDSVMEHLDENGVITDERKPDVVRVAPAPLYNTFADVWNFCRIFSDAIDKALEDGKPATNGTSQH